MTDFARGTIEEACSLAASIFGSAKPNSPVPPMRNKSRRVQPRQFRVYLPRIDNIPATPTLLLLVLAHRLARAQQPRVALSVRPDADIRRGGSSSHASSAVLVPASHINAHGTS